MPAVRTEDLPNLSNATPEFLIDEVGKMNDEKKRLDTLIKYFRAKLDPMIKGKLHVAGGEYEVNLTYFDQERIDAAKVRELLPPDQIAQVISTTSVSQARFAKKTK
jgi:hypothetical protein